MHLFSKLPIFQIFPLSCTKPPVFPHTDGFILGPSAMEANLYGAPVREMDESMMDMIADAYANAAFMATGVPKVVAMAKEMWQEGFDAIIVSCAGDPGVAQARQVVPIPVIGAGESTAALCMFYGSHPAVLGITENIPAGYQRVFGDLIVDNARGNGVESVLDLMMPQGYSATVEQAQRQKKIGADVIALSCTGMSSIQIAPALERETGLPVLDPVMCEGLMTLFELIRKDAQAK